ncbi:EamA-like transporter family [Actinidia rufa]|uniref:EamA-like transporter family n=1 Tax=Actinidia rufa TaxID=165716 RepID=A0A7J0DI09_9ERIC|nr:EamA-like transporter family [Actinidia rufa]
MGWRYKAGLFLILTVIIMWVTSAEVTQGIFEDYDHPFLMAYLGTSLLVLYLPIAFIKNGLFHFIRGRSNSSDDAENTDKSSFGMDSPIKVEVSETENKGLREENGNGMELKSQEEGMALETEQINIDVDKLKQYRELSNKEIARLGFYIAPIWFITEYLTNAALARTSVACTMVLTSTTGLFTLFIGAFLGQDSI